MSNRRNSNTLFFADLKYLHHEGDGVVLLKPIADDFSQDRRCKGPKRFPSFDLSVEDGFHIRAPRIAEDRAVAEGARTPLHPTLEPAEDSALGDRRRGAPAELIFVMDCLDRTTRLHNLRTALGEEPRDLGRRKLRTPECVVHDKRPGAAEPMPHHKGCADRPAGISSSGLYIDAAKRRFASDLAVGDRVHRAPTRERDIAQPRTLLQWTDQVKERLLVHCLHRTGDVAVPVLERVLGSAPRAQQLLERRRKEIVEFWRAGGPRIGDPLPVMAEIGEIERKPTIG